MAPAMHKAQAMAPAMHKAQAMAPAMHKADKAKKSTGYIPPSAREQNPLAPENFPSFRPVNIHVTTRLNFKDAMNAAEEARRRALEAENYDPQKLQTLLPGQLEKEGWKCLPLLVARTASFLQALNERVLTPLTYDELYEYWRCVPLTSKPRLTCHDPEVCSVDSDELEKSFYESDSDQSVIVIQDEV